MASINGFEPLTTSFAGKYSIQLNYIDMAGSQGVEPRLADSESAVLPLDDKPMIETLVRRKALGVSQLYFRMV